MVSLNEKNALCNGSFGSDFSLLPDYRNVGPTYLYNKSYAAEIGDIVDVDNNFEISTTFAIFFHVVSILFPRGFEYSKDHSKKRHYIFK